MSRGMGIADEGATARTERGCRSRARHAARPHAFAAAVLAVGLAAGGPASGEAPPQPSAPAAAPAPAAVKPPAAGRVAVLIEEPAPGTVLEGQLHQARVTGSASASGAGGDAYDVIS